MEEMRKLLEAAPLENTKADAGAEGAKESEEAALAAMAANSADWWNSYNGSGVKANGGSPIGEVKASGGFGDSGVQENGGGAVAGVKTGGGSPTGDSFSLKVEAVDTGTPLCSFFS